MRITDADIAINNWAAAITDKINARSGRTREENLEVKLGRKFAKIICTAHGRSVYCFIERETGNIYKAASWKAPAKHVRGNIADPDGSWGRGVTEWGGSYL